MDCLDCPLGKLVQIGGMYWIQCSVTNLTKSLYSECDLSGEMIEKLPKTLRRKLKIDTFMSKEDRP